MKCIYCNCETELTSSDVIPYAITGAKLENALFVRSIMLLRMIILKVNS